ncbi:hypothetical protein HLV38_02985 [Berryella wangjianweii]|uniref:Uncharacterized protein n=1 Tax=Berryella wangjianweii TaxID=2734634 RepID=A0A6M8J8N6_9ACTN|nr:hypothetical protein [Berryella wangjianweii]QKF07202.1 hypothetical protein HLV38_02985 [Berryella wangjianweii]
MAGADMPPGDIRCKKFAKILAAKADHYPYSDRYMGSVHDSPDKTGRTEREHMTGWFCGNETKGSGAYARQTSNHSSKRCYNSLMNAASLLWIAEAMDIGEPTVHRAFEAAAAAGDYRRACGAIRTIITWDMIYEQIPEHHRLTC